MNKKESNVRFFHFVNYVGLDFNPDEKKGKVQKKSDKKIPQERKSPSKKSPNLSVTTRR